MSATLTTREINGDIARAKRAAEAGPVFITEHGRPSHVLLTYEAWREMAEGQPSILDRLASKDPEAALAHFEPAPLTVGLKPASFE